MVDQPSLFNPPNNFDDIPEMQPIEAIKINKDIPGINLLELVPNSAQLALNRNYSPREIHIGRILSLLSEKEKLEQDMTRDEIIKSISMSKASAQGTINVMRKAMLIDADTKITPFGELVAQVAPYLNDIGLLWLLHYLLASNANLILWSNLFNFSLQTESDISINEITEIFQVLIGRWSEKTINEKAPKEIGGILGTYTNEIFAKLSLIQKREVGIYQVFPNNGNIPARIWLSIILIYRDRYYPGASALEVPLLVNAHYSPGRILLQNEAIVRKVLDELHNADLLTVETRLGLDQVRFKRDMSWFTVFKTYFQEQG